MGKYLCWEQGTFFILFFSKLLVAACEEQGILLYDASNRKRVKTVNYAHQNCVNCVR